MAPRERSDLERFVWRDGDIKISNPFDEIDKAGWPEFVYRLIEHYKWEPQHLGGSVAEFSARMRCQEVPLNFLFNVLLRLLPSDTIRQLLNRFTPEALDGPFRVEHLWSPPYAQPDVRIESPGSRFFIEVKVDERIKIGQVQRYLLLHSEMDEKFGERKPYLFFLTRAPIEESWKPRSAWPTGGMIQESLQQLVGELPEKLSSRVKPPVASGYERIRQNMTYGAATWEHVGQSLAAIKSDGWAIKDFVSELRNRHLLT